MKNSKAIWQKTPFLCFARLSDVHQVKSMHPRLGCGRTAHVLSGRASENSSKHKLDLGPKDMMYNARPHLKGLQIYKNASKPFMVWPSQSCGTSHSDLRCINTLKTEGQSPGFLEFYYLDGLILTPDCKINHKARKLEMQRHRDDPKHILARSQKRWAFLI